MRSIAPTLILLFHLIILSAQNPKDSINRLHLDYQLEQSDINRVLIQFKLADQFEEIDTDSSFYYMDNAITSATRIESDSLEGEGYYRLGRLYDRLNNPKRAMENYLIAQEIFESANIELRNASVLNMIGYSYLNLYADEKAIEYYLNSLTIYTRLDAEDGKAMNYIDIGNLYYSQENYDYAKVYFEDALEIYEILNDDDGIATCYINIGNALADDGDVNEGMGYYQKAIELSVDRDDKYTMAVIYNNIGDCNIGRKKFAEARSNLNRALELSLEIKDEDMIAIVYLNLADLAIQLKNYPEVINFAKKSNTSSKISGNIEFMVQNYKFMADAAEAMGNTSRSLKYLKEHQKIRDSLINLDKEKKVQLFNALNELEKSQFKIDELSVKSEIAQLKYENEKNLSYLLIIGMAVFAFLIILLISQQTAKKKAYNLLEFKNEQIERMNKEIQDQRDHLNQLNQTKNKFFSIIAHDLKNPFNAITGFTELMIENSSKYDEEKRLKFLKVIKGSANKASSLLDNLLIWANSQSGNLEFNPSRIQLKSTVTNVLTLLEIQAMNKDIKIKESVAPEIYLNADENMLHTILRNLVSNAIKFSMPGSTVYVDSYVSENQGCISVKDSGIGIEKQFLPTLFSIDSKYSNVGTANEQGSGLGLILCRDFVERHQGDITVNSIVNEGSEFKFCMPVWQASNDA